MASAITKCLKATTDGEILDVSFKWAISNISFLLRFTEPMYSCPFKSSEDTAWSWYCSITQEAGNFKFGLLFRCNSNLSHSNIPEYTHIKVPAEFRFSLLGPKGELTFTEPTYGMFELNKRAHYATSSLTKSKLLEYKTDPGDELTIVCHVRVFHSFTRDYFPISPCQMQHDFEGILKDPQFADVTLVVEEHKIPAHKAILAARSPVFAAMFSVDMVENTENQVTITDLEYEVAQQLLRFIYVGNAEIEPKMADRLLAAADKYGLKRLKEMCEQTVSKTIAVPTAITTLIFADRMNAEHLKSYTMKFIKANMNKVTESDDWKTMVDEHPKLLVEVCRTLACNSTVQTGQCRKRKLEK